LLRQQFGKRERVARIRVDGVECCRADGTVVGMTDAEPCVVALRRGAYDPLRAHLPDYPGEVAPQRQRRLDLSVRIAKEAQIVHAYLLGRSCLLCLSDGNHLGPGDRPIAAPGLTAGHDA